MLTNGNNKSAQTSLSSFDQPTQSSDYLYRLAKAKSEKYISAIFLTQFLAKGTLKKARPNPPASTSLSKVIPSVNLVQHPGKNQKVSQSP
jgi:hypothetical protein